jgi:hypothetical protein
MANVFITDIENIGKHILAGINKAAPIVAKIATAASGLPVIGPALAEVGQVIAALEGTANTITATEIEQLVIALVTASQIKTAVATAAPSTAPAPVATATASAS